MSCPPTWPLITDDQEDENELRAFLPVMTQEGKRTRSRSGEGAGRRGGPSVRPRQCSTVRILRRMTTPVPTRFSDDELALIDELVDEGVGESRSAVIRQGVHHLADAVRRASVGAAIATSYRDLPQSSEDDDLAMASAIAITEAEPW